MWLEGTADPLHVIFGLGPFEYTIPEPKAIGVESQGLPASFACLPGLKSRGVTPIGKGFTRGYYRSVVSLAQAETPVAVFQVGFYKVATRDPELNLQCGARLFFVNDWFVLLPQLTRWTAVYELGPARIHISIHGSLVTVHFILFIHFHHPYFTAYQLTLNLDNEVSDHCEVPITRALWEAVTGEPADKFEEEWRPWINFPSSW